MIRKSNDEAIAAPVVIFVVSVLAVAFIMLTLVLPVNAQLITAYMSLSNYVQITPAHQASTLVGNWVVPASGFIGLIALVVALIKDAYRERSGMG